VYTLQSSTSLRRLGRDAVTGRLSRRVGSTVVLLGTCSLLTDVSSEMVSAILPVYLVATLGFVPLQYGLLDGIYQGASALVRLASGVVGDRFARHKSVATTGYGLSAVCKLGLALVGSAWVGFGAILLLDRTGKGIRTAPRDAMISMSARREDLGLAFGVHRAMDTAGAMLGPLLAFAILAAAPGAFNSLFLISFAIACLGVGIIALLVREPARERPVDVPPAERPQLRALMRRREFRPLAVASTALALATASDGFIYLALRDRIAFDMRFFPLLATGTALTYMLLAAPLGRLADRVGRGRVFLGGYAVLLAVYCLLLLPAGGTASLLLVLALLGVYYAATDGVLAALGSARIPDSQRGSGLAVLGTTTSLARLLASVLFGALWTVFGLEATIAAFAVALVVAMAVSAHSLRLAHA
jgi:MFS family permease